MPEKAEKKAEEKGAAAAQQQAQRPAPEEKKPAPAAPKGGMLKSTPVLLGIVMIIEAAILFAGFKMFGGGPKSAHGAALVEGHGEEAGKGEGKGAAGKAGGKDLVELAVLNFKAPNKASGRTMLFDVSISVLTKPDCKETLEATIKKSEARIQDGVRTIIAQSDPEKLGGGTEPGLDTFRRQVKVQLEEIVGEGMIEKVLVPRCIPYRGD
jgi:flagellar basal body-associated protein FliL